MPVRARLAAAVALAAAVVLAGCAETSRPPDALDAQTAAARAATEYKVVAVGDIVCAPGSSVSSTRCRHAETAKLTEQLAPDAMIALGDLQYESGSLSAFRNEYDPTWGAFKDLTYPIPGNHEYRTAGASGYFTYFSDRPTGAKGYYSRRLGDWRAYLLNTNCSKVDCVAQRRWLSRSLTERPAKCTLFATHHPRFSSGEHGSQTFVRSFMRIGVKHRVDLVVSGHDHHYERFRRSNADGYSAPNTGFFQFVSGAGGKNHYAANTPTRGSLQIDDDDFGVLELALRPGEFGFAFHTIDGATPDQGVRSCK